MTPLYETFELILLVSAGLLARFGVLLLFVLVVGAPLLALAMAWEALTRPKVSPAGDLGWREDAFYAPGHTWLAPARQGLLFGIDDLARRLLGRATRVSLPRVGTLLKAGERAIAITAGGRSVSLAVPVAATVTAVNRDVLQDPALASRDPYGHGWLLRLRPAESASPLLPRGARGREWLSIESLRFARALELELGVAAADGGEFHVPPHLALDEAQRERLAREFLGQE
ncbi:MAG: glycine cleavage system protein H [Vicinamibacteria bacterium]|nr:glycine cleavage system protein H [Vicinamibacteria bacterium]